VNIVTEDLMFTGESSVNGICIMDMYIYQTSCGIKV